MGKPMTQGRFGQAFNLLSVYANNTDWESLDTGVIQGIIDNPREAGWQFTLFLKQSGRATNDGFKIATAPFDPVSFLGEGWKSIQEEKDKRSAKLKEVDFAKVKYVSCLKEKERNINGEEKLRRLKEAGDIRLGANVFMALWKDYQERKENSVLERLYQSGAIKSYLDFFGNVLLAPGGGRRVPSLFRGAGGRWRWLVRWLEHHWHVARLSAVLPQI